MPEYRLQILRWAVFTAIVALSAWGLLHTYGDAGGHRNVLLITLDTTRADALGCYGNTTVRTPNIDRLAARGTLFTQCISVAPSTLPAHASIMTGTYPFVHGARSNTRSTLKGINVTLAERLAAAGYATAAEIAAVVLDREAGLEQGFATYHDSRTWPVASPTAANDALHERPANEVADAAIRFLERHREDPFFLWVHFFDPHGTYTPPPPYDRQYANRYFGEIAFVDAQVGRVLAALHRHGLERDTIVVLTADHGEGLGDHGEEAHSFFVYDTTMRVPLIVAVPGLTPAGRRVERQVRLIDVAPTILAALKMEALPDTQGVSLVPMFHDPPALAALPAYGESLEPYLVFGCRPPRCLRDDGWKYIHAPRPELYHVAEDAHETRNLADQHPERVRVMQAALRDLLAQTNRQDQDDGAASGIDVTRSANLLALGYVSAEGVNVPPDELALFDGPGGDVKDRVEDVAQMTTAVGLLQGGVPGRAEPIFRALADANPASIEFRRLLGVALARQGKNADAIAVYRAIVADRPDDVESLLALGRLRTAPESLDEALTHYRAVADLAPDRSDGHLGMAVVLRQQHRFGEALIALRAAQRAAPTDLMVMNNLGWLLATCPDGAVRDGAEALRLATRAADETNRQDPSILDTLAAAYAETGRFSEAVTTAADAARLADASGDAALGLAIRNRQRLYQARQPYRTMADGADPTS